MVQGNENYAFVGLYDTNGGPKHTRSVGLLFTTDGENIRCNFEVAIPETEEPKKIAFYKKAVQLAGGHLEPGVTNLKKNYQTMMVLKQLLIFLIP